MTPTNFQSHPLMYSEHDSGDVDDRAAYSLLAPTSPIESASSPPGTPSTASPWRMPANLEPARRNMCTSCGAHFDRPSALKQHILSHTGEKPHACNMCPSRFSTISNLRRHQKSCQAIRNRQEAKMTAASAKAGTNICLRQHRTAARRTLHSLHTSPTPSVSASTTTPTDTPASSPIQSSAPYYPPVISSSPSNVHSHSYSTSTSSSPSASLPTSPSSSVSNDQAPWLTPVQTFNVPQEHVPIQGSIPAFIPTPPPFYPPAGYDYEYSVLPLGGQQQHVGGVGNMSDHCFEAPHMHSNLGPEGEGSAYSNLNQESWTAGPLILSPVWGNNEPATAAMMASLPYHRYSNAQ